MTVAASTGEVGISFDSRYSRYSRPDPRPDPPGGASPEPELLDLDPPDDWLLRWAEDLGYLEPIIDPEAKWSDFPQPKRTRWYCGRPRTVVSFREGWVAVWAYRCGRDGGWTCPRCAPPKVAELLLEAALTMGSEPHLYVSTPTEDGHMPRLRTAMSRYGQTPKALRRARLLGAESWKITPIRHDGQMVSFTNFPLASRKATDPFTEMSPTGAFLVFRAAVALPGLATGQPILGGFPGEEDGEREETGAELPPKLDDLDDDADDLDRPEDDDVSVKDHQTIFQTRDVGTEIAEEFQALCGIAMEYDEWEGEKRWRVPPFSGMSAEVAAAHLAEAARNVRRRYDGSLSGGVSEWPERR